MEYVIRRASARPELKGIWEGPAWRAARTLDVANFHTASSSHRPLTHAKVLYDREGLYVIFRVKDRYVRSTRLAYNSHVCRDSCVEFFVQPKPGHGYFNIEINCGGTLLMYYVQDPSRNGSGKLFDATPLPGRLLDRVKIHHTMPRRTTPEIRRPVEWFIEYFVPFELFERYVGPLNLGPRGRWRGNFYKCADTTSHPHWASWSPIGERLNFHMPEYFAPLRFAR